MFFSWLGRLPNVDYEEMHNNPQEAEVEANVDSIETEPHKEKI